MVKFRISRFDREAPAHVLDMGDLTFVFDDKIMSTEGNSRYANMVYLSVVELIDILTTLRRGAKSRRFVAADSSFTLMFEQKRQHIYVWNEIKKYGPFFVDELLAAVNAGIDHFLADPLNELLPNGPMHGDFHESCRELKEMLLGL
ncbi:hypothetical protein [Massilia sp. CCM 8734]|uniref:hypothetical protein n=1 Tax=Massilia sp. CCM 8734 TaxID=2609283 RepID=UPI0014235338|nr:hypothetical protein [Massilia sp. CCM 8734]NHZ99870.1 hypothetical protein [Massilia sp. CCM 8734]